MNFILACTYVAAVLLLKDSNAVPTNENEIESGDASSKKVVNHTGTVAQRTKLLNSLTQNYDRRINPDLPSGIKFGVALINVDINEEKSTMESNTWLRHVWEDSRLVWDESEWGINVLRVPSKTLWTPDITLYNSADLSKNSESCWDSNALIYPHGEVLWVPPCHFSSMCELTLKDHPSDEQTCILKFGSWTFDGNIMDLHLYNDKPEVDMSDFWDQSNWKVISTVAERHEKYYPCCDEPYIDITFNVTLQKKE